MPQIEIPHRPDQDLFPVGHGDKGVVGFRHQDFRAGFRLDPACHTAMIPVTVADEDPVDVLNRPADALHGGFKDGKGFRGIEPRIEKCDPAAMQQRIHMHVLQPKGHGECDDVKIFVDFLDHDRMQGLSFIFIRLLSSEKGVFD